MSLIKNVMAPIAVAASLVLAPLSASALSVKFFDGGSEVAPASLVATPTLLVSTATIGTAQIAVTATVLDFPPVDQFFSTFNVVGEVESVRIEVTHFFDNGTPFDSVGLGSVANNFQSQAAGFSNVGSSVNSAIFIGDEEFTQDTEVTSSDSILDVVSQGLVTAGGSYWVTQVLEIEFAATGGTATAEWINPAAVIPLPAGGLLLLTALGGLGLYRARKS